MFRHAVVFRRTDNNSRILSEFFDSTAGSIWNNQGKKWKSTSPLRRWFGISVGINGTINGIELPSNNLSGSGTFEENVRCIRHHNWDLKIRAHLLTFLMTSAISRLRLSMRRKYPGVAGKIAASAGTRSSVQSAEW